MLRLIVLCAFFAFVRCETTAVEKCQNYDADPPINQQVVGCATPPCLLPQGQDVVINVVFRSPRNLRTMRTLATAFVVFGIPITIPYDLGAGAVTCNFLTNTYCPVLKNEVVKYTLRMYIAEIFPTDLPVTVEFRVVDDRGLPIWCIRLPIMVVPPEGALYEANMNKTISINV